MRVRGEIPTIARRGTLLFRRLATGFGNGRASSLPGRKTALRFSDFGLRFSARPRAAGFTLIQVIVYLGVAVVIMNLAGFTFFAVLEHLRAVRYDTTQVTSALHAGERWRADIRHASAPPKLIQEDDGPLLVIPQATNQVFYKLLPHWALRRPRPHGPWQFALTDLAETKFVRDQRGPVSAWRWEVRFADRRGRRRPTLAFTFQAVRPTTAP